MLGASQESGICGLARQRRFARAKAGDWKSRLGGAAAPGVRLRGRVDAGRRPAAGPQRLTSAGAVQCANRPRLG